MRAIVHIGMPKAGSTSLQNSLADTRGLMIKEGVLYPLIKGMGNNHFLLGAMLSGRLSDYRIYKNIYNNNDYAKIKSSFLKSINKQINSYKPKVIILSAESLSPYPVCKRAQVLYTILKNWTDEISIVYYVREPVTLYISTIQQQLKASSKFDNPYEFNANYQNTIKEYEKVFPGKIIILPFEPSNFFNNSIYHDFIINNLPELFNRIKDINFSIKNRSLDVETSYCIQKFRIFNYPENDDEFNISTNLYNKILLDTQIEIKQETNNKKKLKDKYKEIILKNNYDDLVWMKNKYNIIFKNINYDAIKLFKVKKRKEIYLLSDVVCVNHDYAQILEQKAIHKMVENYSSQYRFKKIKKKIKQIINTIHKKSRLIENNRIRGQA